MQKLLFYFGYLSSQPAKHYPAAQVHVWVDSIPWSTTTRTRIHTKNFHYKEGWVDLHCKRAGPCTNDLHKSWILHQGFLHNKGLNLVPMTSITTKEWVLYHWLDLVSRISTTTNRSHTKCLSYKAESPRIPTITGLYTAYHRATTWWRATWSQLDASPNPQGIVIWGWHQGIMREKGPVIQHSIKFVEKKSHSGWIPKIDICTEVKL